MCKNKILHCRLKKENYHVDTKKQGQLTFIGDETVIVLGVAALLDQDVHLLTLKLLTKTEQHVTN